MKWVRLPLLLGALLSLPSVAQNVDELTRLAEQGNVQAQFELAQHYAHDESASSTSDASYWLEQAAQSGHLQASVELAKQALQSPVDQNTLVDQGTLADKLYWLVNLAAAGDVNAQTALAKLYQSTPAAAIQPSALAEVWYHIASPKSDDAQQAYSELLEAQFNQRRAKQLASDPAIDAPLSAAQNPHAGSAFWPWLLSGILAIIWLATLSLLFKERFKKRQQSVSSQASEQQLEQLHAQIQQQNTLIKQQKRQLEGLFRQFKKLETEPVVAKPEPKDHKLGLAASMFGFRLSSLPDEKQIKTRYKQLCKIYHPDLKGSDDEMKRLNHALKILLAHVNQ